MKKVLFLDIDGVLNSNMYAHTICWLKKTNRSALYSGLTFKHGIWQFCPYASAIFSSMMEELLNVDIVISSTWRVGRTVEDLQQLFIENGLCGSKIIGRTGDFKNSRGLEIQEYLDLHPDIKKFVILDDDNDMLHLTKYLVKTDTRNGLLFKDADLVIKKFRK